ncbi:hypothetical protein JCM17380_47330 [Desulfosporosinus burensis]
MDTLNINKTRLIKRKQAELCCCYRKASTNTMYDFVNNKVIIAKTLE